MIGRLLRRYVLNEWKLKALSLAFACLLWLGTTYLGETTITLSVPVQMNNLARNLVVKSVDTRNLVVTLGGPLSRLKNVKPEDVKISVDLSRASEGRQVRTIRKTEVLVPSGLKVADIRPDYVVVEVDALVEKWLDTVVKLDEKSARAYHIVSWSPRQVLVEGARDTLADRRFIETVPVEGEFSRPEEAVQVALDTRNLFIKKVKPDTVRVVLRRTSK